MTRIKLSQRLLSLFLCITLIFGYAPITAMAAIAPLSETAGAQTVTDPGTADTWEHMMGTDTDGNRYAGRVWVDKSVYKDGDTAVLNNRGGEGSSFRVSLENDEQFQVIFSALGSTMTTKESTTSTGPMDVVLVLDTSTSMDDVDSMGVTRLERTITAANGLLDDLLTIKDVRIAIVTYNADSETVLPLAAYKNGIDLVVTDYYNNGSSDAGVVTAYDNAKNVLGRDSGYTRGTNLQSGIDRGFNLLANASDVQGRAPVAIVLTDGQANRASQEGFYELASHTDKDGTSASNRNLYLSTLLNAAYTKTKIEAHYGKDATVYTVGVDITNNVVARLLMNPADATNGFHARNANTEVKRAYENFQKWAKGEGVTYSGWTFDHNYPKQSGAITYEKIAANIHYSDAYYDVSNANLESTFQQIYEELSSGVFNPISSSTTTAGGTGVENTPLIYVDFIGQHMQVKEIQSVTLFGASYSVVKNPDGTYTVDEQTGTNPTTQEAWNTAEDILISVTEQADGTQKLEIRIHQEILPIIMEQVVAETVGNVTSATINELIYDPLRVYYTVGLDSDALLPNGKIDVSKIQGYPHMDDNAGTATFYSGQFGVMNPADSSGTVTLGDAHVGFKPSLANRYYYHQANQGIFTKITNKADGSTVTVNENNEYGIVWDEAKYDLTWMSYADYQAARDDDKVYTYVTYYHPTPSAGDAASAAEEVTYLVYTDWRYLKESAAFYDATSGTYLNNGVAIPEGEVAGAVSAYLQNNPNAQIYAVLGVGSLRTSRLHNMTVVKTANNTHTAQDRYAPEYTHDTASVHNGNDVVVWLGNNGKLTVDIETGIALTKQVTEAIGSPEDTYPLTVTVPAGVTATPVVTDMGGNDVTATISTYSNNVLTVNLKAGQTVYISGIPGGTVCEVGENIHGDYYIASQTTSVKIPLVSEALNGAVQFAPAVVTNAPNKYGDLTVIKDIRHDLTDTPEAMADKVFTFQVQLPAALAGKSYPVDAANTSLFTGTQVTVGSDGSITLELKDNESITIMGLPEGTPYTVTETSAVPGYTDTTGPVSGTIAPDGDHDAHFVNAYGYTPIKPAVTVTGTKFLNDIHGTYTDNEDFIFVLSRYTGNDYEEVARTTAKAGASYQFKLDALLTQTLELGDHYFRITEESGATEGMTYDSSRGLFVVRITDDNADGIPEYKVVDAANTSVSGTAVTKNFTNIYDVKRTHADINITKTLVNTTGVALPLNMFHFVLVNTANPDNIPIQNIKVTTDASGKATIRLSELGVGQYTYTLTEEQGTLPGMTYDTAPRYITVTVTENAGVLTATVSINGESTNNVTFRNVYALTQTSHTITGTKVLEGRNPANNEFSFALYETDASFVTTGNPKETVKNVGSAFSFSPISYTRVGTHYYVVKEIPGSVAGVTYDTTHYHITVTVGVDGEMLTKRVAVNRIGHNSDTGRNVVFVNTYKATPTQYTFNGIKVLHGRAPRAGEFTFELYEGATRKESVSNKGDGSFAFTPVSFTAPGTYTYTVKEAAPKDAEKAMGVTYTGAEAPVTVTVEVIDDNAALKVNKVTILDKNGTANAIRFENFYTAKPAEVIFQGTKALEGGNPANHTFTFKLYETDQTFSIAGKSGTAVKNIGSAFSFAPISLTAAGTYFYAVVEDAGENPVADMVYDRTQHNYAVQVSDIGDGQLRATVTNVTTGAVTQPAPSETVNLTFTNATFDKATEKEVYHANTTTEIDGKQVNAGDILTYFITYTNYTGKDVVADIMDTIPNHTSYVENSASHNGTYAGTHLNWILNVPTGESVTVSFDVKVNETEAIVANTAVVRDGVNTYHTNEVVNHTVEEPLEKDVFTPADVTVSIDGEKVNVGQELVYQLTFTNTSGDTVKLQITDTIPANTTYVAGSADNGGVYADGAIVWNLDDVPAWGTVTVTFKVTVDADAGGEPVTNQAKATDGKNSYISNEVSNLVNTPEPPVNPENPETPENPVNPETPVNPENPKTGDAANLVLWFALLSVSCAAVVGLAIAGKKQTEEATE